MEKLSSDLIPFKSALLVNDVLDRLNQMTQIPDVM